MQAFSQPARGLVFISLFLISLSATSQAQTGFAVLDPASAAITEQLEQALQQRGSIDFVETPLQELMEVMGQQFRVPFVLQATKLEEAAVSLNTPVTKKISNLPLESILELLLDELELDFTIRHNVILITTPEDVESQLDTRLYPVLDLVVPRGMTSPQQAVAAVDYEPLYDVITRTLAPQSWDEVGGPGSITALDNAGVLIISQTRGVHRQIEHLLASLRRVKSHQGIPSLPQPSTASRCLTSRPAMVPARQYSSSPAQPWQLPQVYAE